MDPWTLTTVCGRANDAIGQRPGPFYHRYMEVDLSPGVRDKLNELALRTGRGTDELLGEAVGRLLDYEDWLDRKVAESEEAVARGEIVSHKEVRRWAESRARREDHECV